MSSKFSRRQRVKFPTHCLASLTDLPTLYLNDQPTRLSVFADWPDTSGTEAIAQAFSVIAQPPYVAWHGASGMAGPNLALLITREPTTFIYTITLQFRRDLTMEAQHTFQRLTIAKGPPFDSGLLNEVLGFDPAHVTVHVRD